MEPKILELHLEKSEDGYTAWVGGELAPWVLPFRFIQSSTVTNLKMYTEQIQQYINAYNESGPEQVMLLAVEVPQEKE